MHRFGREYDRVARERLAPRAREMRIAPTRSEELLWSALRRGALGVRVRRQVVLGPYIADFFVPSAKLVIEVDGGVHRAHRDADRIRDARCAANGLRVVRVDAALVEHDVAHAVAIVRAAPSRDATGQRDGRILHEV